MSAFDVFDAVYCVNLKRDPDRKQQASKEFNNICFSDVVWLSADPPNSNFTCNAFQVPGELGCTLSHLKIITDAIGSNPCYGIAVFEDDLMFGNIDHLSSALDELPTDWDVLYFGGNPYEKVTRFSPNLVTVGKFMTTVGYAISAKALSQLAMYTIDCLGQPYPTAVADVILNTFAIQSNAFCVYPPVVSQRPGKSTLRKMYRDYTALIDTNWKKYKP